MKATLFYIGLAIALPVYLFGAVIYLIGLSIMYIPMLPILAYDNRYEHKKPKFDLFDVAVLKD